MNVSLKTAIVGTSYGLNVLLPALQAVPFFQVVALCGRNQRKVLPVTKKLGVTKVFADWQPLVDDPTIEVVALALPPLFQGRAAVALARAGKHLFCEKPLAATLADATAIRDALAHSGRMAVVDFGFRFVDAFRDFQKIVCSAQLGRPQSVQVEWLLASRNDPTLTWNWKSDAAQGGGAFFMMGSHVLDYLGWFFGEIERLHFQTVSLVPARPDPETGVPKPVQADDTCHLLLTLSGGLTATVTISTALAVAGNHRIRVWFEKGLLELSNRAGDDYYDGFDITFQPGKNCAALPAVIEKQAAKPNPSRLVTGRIAIAQRVAESFAAALASGQPPEPSVEAALKVQRWLEAGLRPAAG